MFIRKIQMNESTRFLKLNKIIYYKPRYYIIMFAGKILYGIKSDNVPDMNINI